MERGCHREKLLVVICECPGCGFPMLHHAPLGVPCVLEAHPYGRPERHQLDVDERHGELLVGGVPVRPESRVDDAGVRLGVDAVGAAIIVYMQACRFISMHGIKMLRV
jgi:hypothetical protein